MIDRKSAANMNAPPNSSGQAMSLQRGSARS